MKASIKAITYVQPQETISSEEFSRQLPNTDIAKTENFVGCHVHHVAPEGTTASDLAVEAAKKLFSEYDTKPDDIDFVIFCTQCADYFMPSTACTIQSRLGIPQTAGAYDCDLGCSGYIYGLAQAKGLIFAGIAKNILLLTGDTPSKVIHPKDNNRLLFGDAASATLISDVDSGAEIEDFVFGTDGTGYDKIIIKNGAFRHHQLTGHAEKDDEGNLRYDDYFYMAGESVFNFTLDCVPKLVMDVEHKNRLTGEDIDYYIFHQPNKFMLNTIRKITRIPKDKFYVDIEENGNTTSSSVPIGLKRAWEAGKIHKGSTVMIAGFGVGLSWGGTILQF